MLLAPISAHDKVIKALVKVQDDYPFYSYILCHFRMTADTDGSIPTAGVDKHGNFYYDEGFITSLNIKEMQGVLLHEALHTAKGDFFRKGKRDSTIWNIASDCIINYILKQESITLPKCALNPDSSGNITLGGKVYNVVGKVTEELYEELYQNATKIYISCGGGKEKGKGEGKDGKNQSHGGFDVHIETDDSSAENAQEESKWKKVVVEAATNAQARGKLPGCMEGIIDKILNPTIDWRTRIQKFITSEIPVDYTNRLPGRSFYGTGVWCPKVLRENLDVFVSIDVSGSTMSDREYFIGEISGILRSYEQIHARLIFWDASVNPKNDHAITRNNRDTLTDIKIEDCNGGTRMSSYAEYCEKMEYKCKLHIIMTDGFIEANPVVPSGSVIFVLTKNGTDKHIKDLGVVCRLSDIEED